MENKQSILVMGAGSWGTALSVVLKHNGHNVWLWSLETPNLIEDCISEVKDILIVVPSHAFRETLKRLTPYLTSKHRICWATKGLENNSGLLLHQVAEQELGSEQALAVLSGPSFASEVAAGLPTAVTIASSNLEYAQDLVKLFHNHSFRPYTSSDIIGVQIGGALKNIIAIAAGIADGLGFGANTRTALITRGLREIMRCGIALGGKTDTFMGLAGLGDLVLTCTDNQSRNRRFGYALAQGKDINQAQTDIGQVVEGMWAAREVRALAKQLGIEMPIVEQVDKVLQGISSPHEAVEALLSRQLKPEFDES
jgi:glycerol-3-phosphate dehydrogenase (NAD(P)+)